MMTNEESTEIVSFITPGAGGLVPGCDHKSHIVKIHYFFQKLLPYFWGWFRQTQKDSFDVPIDSYCINRLYCSFPPPLFFGGAVDLTRSQCTVSDTQMTIGLLFFLNDQHCVQIMCHLCSIKMCFLFKYLQLGPHHP